MDKKCDKNLHQTERKAILEAEKRNKPGECLKVENYIYNSVTFIFAEIVF